MNYDVKFCILIFYWLNFNLALCYTIHFTFPSYDIFWIADLWYEIYLLKSKANDSRFVS